MHVTEDIPLLCYLKPNTWLLDEKSLARVALVKSVCTCCFSSFEILFLKFTSTLKICNLLNWDARFNNKTQVLILSPKTQCWDPVSIKKKHTETWETQSHELKLTLLWIYLKEREVRTPGDYLGLQDSLQFQGLVAWQAGSAHTTLLKSLVSNVICHQ